MKKIETFALKRFLFKDQAKAHGKSEFTRVDEHLSTFLTTYLGKKILMQKSKTIVKALLIATFVFLSNLVMAYPTDGYNNTGIKRLDFFQAVKSGEINDNLVQKYFLPGASLSLSQVGPRLLESKASFPNSSAELSAQLSSLIPDDPTRYSVALLDVSDPSNIRYAEHNSSYRNNVGSVGKILVVLAILNTLSELYPDDIEKRRDILRTTSVRADEFSRGDHHTVRLWDVENRALTRRAMKDGDEGSLYDYMDWAVSPSSNAAAATLQRELVLMNAFGAEYPKSYEESRAYLNDTPKSELAKLFRRAMDVPITSSGLDINKLRQGSFFSRIGKSKVPGTSSYGNPRELVKLLFMAEQGQLIDEFSSTELKRLLYMTERRIRYASHPNLRADAVYFKSGSLYSCQAEEGFKCGKYKGNKRNLLASVAIIESSAEERDLHYIVVVQSNMLKVNSALAHQTLAGKIHKMVKRWNAEANN